MSRSPLSKLGVTKWLDMTKDEHKGHGGAEFARLVKQLSAPQDGFTKVTIQGIADYYGVHRHTATDWVKRYNKSNEKNNDRSDV